MLSVSARFPTTSNWVLLELARNEHILLYKSVADAWPEMRNARHRQDLFPFPPESVAHMAHVFSQVQGISRRWAKEIGDARTTAEAAPQHDATAHERADASCALRYHNDLFPAMLLLGASAGPDQVAHEQCTLTLSSVQDGRELACMSWEHGLLFSAHIGRCVILEATEPTHEWPDTAKISNCTIRPFANMPLPDGASVCLSEFYELLKHGIVMQDDGILVDLNPKKKAGARSLPCVLCPVVHWPVLLLLVQSGWTVPGRAPLTLRASSQVFSEHAAKHSVLRVAADTGPRVAPRVSEFAAAELCGAELLARAVGQCLALDDVSALYFVAEPHVIWRQHADSSLVLFASAAELCYSVCVPEQDASCCAAFVAEHAEHGLCNVRTLESGRHVARYWKFWARSALQELRDEAARLWTDNQALARRDGADAFEQEKFDNTRETLADNRAETEQHFADASVAGSRTYLNQTIFDMSSRIPRFTPAGDVLLHTPEPADRPVSAWGLVLERDKKFLRNGCYAVSVADPLDGGALLFNMDFATMSRAMLQEGSELWIGIDNSVYSRIMSEANAQGTKIMLPVSDELHARLKTDSAVSRQLRAFYVLGGSSSVKAIDRNSVRVIIVVANKSCSPGRKSASDDNAGAASRINVSISQNDFKMLTICLPMYTADSSLSVTYNSDQALPFYQYMKEDNTARSRTPRLVLATRVLHQL